MLFESIRKHVKLSADEAQMVLERFKTKQYRRGEILVSPGNVCRYDIFILKGSIKTYYSDIRGASHIIQFGVPGWWAGDFNSFIKQVPATLTTQAMEDTTVGLISYGDLSSLMKEIPQLERYFRIIIQNAYANFQERTLQNLSANAEERYLNFQIKYPQLDRLLPQKEIAAYLGMSAEFLSKIKKRLHTK
nr:Crp/Fnr family transcriptional regulator [Pedobacter sp. SYSU D00873]